MMDRRKDDRREGERREADQDGLGRAPWIVAGLVGVALCAFDVWLDLYLHGWVCTWR